MAWTAVTGKETMTYTLAQKLLQTHREEVEQRAAEGGHELGDWQRVTTPSLFDFVAVCGRCEQRAFVSETAVYIAFAPTCPGEPAADM